MNTSPTGLVSRIVFSTFGALGFSALGFSALVNAAGEINVESDATKPLPFYSAEAVTQRLASRELLHGLFSQTREVQGVTGGLSSSGEFYFWRGHGIYLATLQPIVQATTYRPDVTLRWSAGEVEPQKLNRRQDRHFRELLIAIFDFDKEKLGRDFKQSWAVDENGWQLALEPRNFASKRFLESITLSGTAAIDRLSIESQSGETLRIEFTETKELSELAPQICVERFLYSAETCGIHVEHDPN